MSCSWSSTQSPGMWATMILRSRAARRLDPLQVLGVLGHVLPRGLQVGDEGDLLAELRVLAEEGVEGGEAAEHVLREVSSIDADDQVLATPIEYLPLGGGDLGRGGGAF